MIAVAAPVLGEDRPDGVQLAVLAQEVDAAEFGNGDIPDSQLSSLVTLMSKGSSLYVVNDLAVSRL